MSRMCLSVILLAFVAGCSHTNGHDFMTPTSAQIILGQTTKSDIFKAYGYPDNQSTFIKTDSGQKNDNKAITEFDPDPTDGNYENVLYSFAESRNKDALGLVKGIFKAKSVRFLFWNGNLILYNYESSFENSSSNFDESKVSSLKKGQMQKSDVHAILGEPTGRAAYPAIQTNGNELYVYAYSFLDTDSRKVTSKALLVLFNNQGLLLDYRFASDTHDLPQSPAPQGGGYVPIFIPSGHK